MYQFLRSPKWIVGIAIAIAAVVAFVNLGLWQLSRHEERLAFNTTLTSRIDEAPVDLATAASSPSASAYRRGVVQGTFVTEREVLLAARSLDGRAGHHVLTPLETSEGVVIVNRGWVPLELTDVPIDEATPPSGVVEVEGVWFPNEEAARSGSFRGGAELEFVSAVDLEVLERWVGEPVAPLYLLAQAQEPATQGDLPAHAALPEVETGNHVSYAVQWFLFAGVVTVGFPLLVRRTARDQAQGDRGEQVTM